MTSGGIFKKKNVDCLYYEGRAWNRGFKSVAGLDEAGRGPLAGPVVAGCVILPNKVSGLEAVTDSKRLNDRQRRDLFILIHEKACDIGVGIVDAPTIDRMNILQATFLAMKRAVESMARKADYFLVDGNRMPTWIQHGEAIVSGDILAMSISAASIIAKVTRDRIMEDYDGLYPSWGFARHKGYGTAEHLEAIQQYGICDLHRRSFTPVLQLGLNLGCECPS